MMTTMFLNLVTDAFAMAPANGGAGQGGASPLILIFVVFYFLLIRPQQKKAKEHQNMINNLKKGDKVILAGGEYGVVDSVGTNTVTVKIAENVKVKYGKPYISALRAPADED
ncbi:MAG: preprotein translocase subunit YajC [Thermodesulfovibrionales bacterium]